MLAFLRIIKFAFQDIGRNFSLSFMTILILILMLLSMDTLISVRALTQEAVGAIKDQIDVSIYFRPEVTDENITEIRTFVESFPEVTGIEYKKPDEVMAEFQEVHKENPEILSSLTELGQNPFGPIMVVKTREPGDYEKVITAISIPEYETIIEAKTFGDTQKAIERVDVITKNVEKFVLALSALFALIAFFVIFNTIRVAIYTQRIEIGIKKLVGATNWFIRGPFVIESLFFTVVSVALSGVVVYFITRTIDPYITVIFGVSGFLTNYFASHILLLAGIQFGAVLLLTILTSGLAMRRYLRV